MGCCLTTSAAAADDYKANLEPRDAPPPPPAFEEETVKQVLLETSVVSNSTPRKLTCDNQRVVQPREEVGSGNGVLQLTKNPIEENASEVSTEIYSYCESFSAATTPTTLSTDHKRDEIDEDGEVTQKINNPPPAKKVPRRRPTTSSVERAGRKESRIRPPPRRSPVPSPDKKGQLPSRNIATAQRQGPSKVARREPPARRSKSPAMRGEARQFRKVKERIPLRKSDDRSPEYVRENDRKFKLVTTNDGVVVPEPEPEPEPKPGSSESLENPLVSFECFIFL